MKLSGRCKLSCMKASLALRQAFTFRFHRQAYMHTGRCETTANGVNRFASLVQHRSAGAPRGVSNTAWTCNPRSPPPWTRPLLHHQVPSQFQPSSRHLAGIFSPGRRIDHCTEKRLLRTRQLEYPNEKRLRPSCRPRALFAVSRTLPEAPVSSWRCNL